MRHINHASIKEEGIQHPVQFCPNCGESLRDPKSLLNVFTQGENFVYFCWCRHCSWRGEIMAVTRVTTSELAGN